MAYNVEVANRVREALADADVEPLERQMFGGLAFMVHGHMTVGIVGDDLMVRVGKEAHGDALALPHTRPMDFTGKPMTSMVYVEKASPMRRACVIGSIEAWPSPDRSHRSERRQR